MTLRGAVIFSCGTASFGCALAGATESIYLYSLLAAVVVGYILPPQALWSVVCGALAIWVCVAWALPFTINHNIIAGLCALALASALAYELWWYIPWGLGSILLLGSRGAIIAAAVVGVMWMRSWKIGLAILTLSFLLVAAYSFDRDGVPHRLAVWREALGQLTLWGSGWGSFAEVPHWHYGQITSHVYNDYLELLHDLGLGTIPLWIALIFLFESNGSKLVPIAFLVLALSYFPLHVPVLGHLGMMSFGALARRLPNGKMEVSRSALLKHH